MKPTWPRRFNIGCWIESFEGLEQEVTTTKIESSVRQLLREHEQSLKELAKMNKKMSAIAAEVRALSQKKKAAKAPAPWWRELAEKFDGDPVLPRSCGRGGSGAIRSDRSRKNPVLVLDTDLMSILLRGPAPQRAQLMDWLQATGDEVAVTVITFEEQMRGWLAVIARAKAPEHQIAVYLRLHSI